MEFTSGLFFTANGNDGFSNDVVKCLMSEFIMYHICVFPLIDSEFVIMEYNKLKK